MDIFDEDLRKAHSRRLILGYFLFAIIIGLTTWLLLLSAQGYKFDPNKGVTQNALIYLDSKPLSSSVYVDGKATGDRTDVKLSLPVGKHSIKLEAEGYRSWQKEIDLEAQAVEFLTYVKLFPSSITTEDVVALERKPLFFDSSPDSKWLAVGRATNSLIIDFYNTSKINDQPLQLVLSLPKELENPTLGGIEWSKNGEAVLVKLSKGAAVSNVLVNRTSGTIQAVGSGSSTSLLELKFYKNGTTEMTGLDANRNLFKINSDTPSLTTTISAGVEVFSVDNDNVLALRKASDLKQNELILVSADNSIKVLATLPETIVNPHVWLMRYDGAENAVVSFEGQNKLLYVYRNPMTQIRTLGENRLKPTIALRLDSAKNLTVSPNNRFIGVFGEGNAMVYDQDLQNLNRFRFEANGAASDNAQWIDSFRLGFNVVGGGFVCDFDGTNLQNLVSLVGEFPMQKDEDFKNVFSVGLSTATGTYSIQKSDLVAD